MGRRRAKRIRGPIETFVDYKGPMPSVDGDSLDPQIQESVPTGPTVYQRLERIWKKGGPQPGSPESLDALKAVARENERQKMQGRRGPEQGP